MKRKAITPAMKIKCLLHRYDIRCSECLCPLRSSDEIEWDHIHALVHGGAHEFLNFRPLHVDCHRQKTRRDIAANAKVKRILADKPSKRPMKSSGRKMPSRPFQKRSKAPAAPERLSTPPRGKVEK